MYRTVSNVANIDRPLLVVEHFDVSEFSPVEKASQFFLTFAHYTRQEYTIFSAESYK